MNSFDANVPFIFAIVAFLVLCLFFVGVLQYVSYGARKRSFQKRFREDAESFDESARPPQSSDQSEDRVRNLLTTIAKRLSPKKVEDSSRSRERFLKAGMRSSTAAGVFWGAKILAGVCLPASFLLLSIGFLRIFSTPRIVALAVALAFLGLYVPEIWLKIRISKRRDKISRAIPDALDLMTICLEAGMGLDATINRVGEELQLSHPVLSDELKLMTLELRGGKSRQEALRRLAARTDVEDLNSLVQVLVQAEKFGTSIANTLRVYADGFRTKRYNRAEEQAAKMPVKLIFPLAMLMLPTLLMVLLGPALIRIIRTAWPWQ
jgi:tight adherence protein C